MKILIISPGGLPIPARKGGAIETLVEMYLKYNETNSKDNITVYSTNLDNKETECSGYKYSEFRYINYNIFSYKIINYIRVFIDRILTNQYLGNIYINLLLKDLKFRNELNKYDVIICENIGKYGILLKKRLQYKKMILHLHNDYLNIETKRNRKIIEAFDEVWCVSKFIKNRVKEIKTDCKAEVLYNSIEFSRFEKEINVEEIIELKKKYGIKQNDFIVSYIGRIMPEKGIYNLLNAFEKINKKYDNIKLLIVGGPKNLNCSKDRLFKKILKKAKKYNGKIILTGSVDNNSMPIYYKLGNLQVVPSIWNEAFGLTIIEGMLSKNPLIVSNTGAIPEIVGENTAIIVSKDNLTENLVKAIENLYNNKKLCQDIVNNAYKRVQIFNKENYCKRFETLLKDI